MKKLRNKRGETLIEALAAILIFTLATVALFSLITTATDLNRYAKESDAKTQEQLVAAEQGASNGQSGTVTLTLTSSSEEKGVQVTVYGDRDGGLYAYYPD